MRLSAKCEGRNPRARKTKKKTQAQANEPQINLSGYLQRICGVDLTQIIGLNALSVLLNVSEIGVDMSKWRNAKAFCSCAKPYWVTARNWYAARAALSPR